MSRFNSRVPRYNDDSDYTTNAPSYYDDLARKQKLIKELAKRIWDYEKTLEENLQMLKDKLKEIEDIIGEGFDLRIEELLREWVDDGTLENIINEEIFNTKADKDWVIDQLNEQVYYDGYKITEHYDSLTETIYWITEIKMNEDTPFYFDVTNETTGETVREYANREKTTVSINASTMNKEGSRIFPEGVAIIDGEVIEDRATNTTWKVGITRDNRLTYFEPGDTSNEIFKKEPNIRSVLTAFTPLIIDSDQVSEDILADGRRYNYNDNDPRQVIAQNTNGDIIFLTSGGRGFGGNGLTVEDVFRLLDGRNITFAFMLDGGGSTSLIDRGTKLNPNIDNLGTKERKRPSFISIGTIDNRPISDDIKDIYSRLSDIESDLSFLKDLPAELTTINNRQGSGFFTALKDTEGVPHNDVNLWFIDQLQIRHQKVQIAYPYSFTSNTRENGTMFLRRTEPSGENWMAWVGSQDARRITSLDEDTKQKDMIRGIFYNNVSDWNIWGDNKAGTVMTINENPNDFRFCKQFFYQAGSHHYYERFARGNGETWSDWYRYRGETESDD